MALKLVGRPTFFIYNLADLPEAAAATGSTASDKHKDDDGLLYYQPHIMRLLTRVLAMEVQPTTRKVKIMKATDSRDKREKRKTFRKNRSSTTFSSRITRSSKRKS